jgi:hypothetical protein
MSAPRTCREGCHRWNCENETWDAVHEDDFTAELSWEDTGLDKLYCFASHAELLPDGVVREMVALEVAVDAVFSALGGDISKRGHWSREELEAHLLERGEGA